MKKLQQSIIVVDTNALLVHSKSILEVGVKNKLVTTSSVFQEVLDSKTKQAIDNYPFKIQTMEPSKQAINIVKEFAKKTGDIASLSDVDIGLLALTYNLYINHSMQNQLNKNPHTIKQNFTVQNQISDNSYSSQQQNQQNQNQEDIKNIKEVSQNQQDQDGWVTVASKKKYVENDTDSDMDDEEGWITPKNFTSKMNQTQTLCQTVQVQTNQISIMTTDYAMQNVATQMGMKLLTPDGRRIRSIRRFIWQCYLCWKQYKLQDNTIKLCSNCGYNSLSKVAYSIDSEGNMIMHRKKGWKPNQKILQWKERKFQQQQKKKKHQHERRKKKPSIFETY